MKSSFSNEFFHDHVPHQKYTKFLSNKNCNIYIDTSFILLSPLVSFFRFLVLSISSATLVLQKPNCNFLIIFLYNSLISLFDIYRRNFVVLCLNFTLFSVIMLLLRVTNAPNTTIVPLRIGLCKSIWNKVSLVHYHDFIDLTIFFLIKKIMNLSLVIVSQIVCHIL